MLNAQLPYPSHMIQLASTRFPGTIHCVPFLHQVWDLFWPRVVLHKLKWGDLGISSIIASSSFYEGSECWISIGEFDEPFCIDDENIVLGDICTGPDDGDGRPNLVHDKEDFTMNII